MIRNFIENNKAICVIISVAVIIHVGLFFTLKSISIHHPLALHSSFPIPGGGYDPIDYTTLARNILRYDNFSMQSGPLGAAETYRSPGDPFFIAAVEYLTGTLDAVPMFQIVLVALTTLIVYLTVLEVLPGYRKTALAISILFICDPVIFFSSQFIATEALYAFLFLLAMYLLIKKTSSPLRTWGCAGVALGLSALARPSGFYMSIPIGIWIIIRLFRRQNRLYPEKVKLILKQTAIFLVALGAIVLSWTVRNGIRTGVYEYSSLSTYNTMFNLPVYLSYKDTRPIEDIRAELDARMGYLTDEQKRDSRNGPLMRKIEWEILKPNLVNYVFFHVSKSANFFLAPGLKFSVTFFQGFWAGEVQDTWHPETSFVNSVIEHRWGDVAGLIYQNILYFPESLFLLLMFVFGLYWSLFSKIESAKLIFGCILFLGLLTSPITNPRYRVPVLPLIYLAGMAGVSLALESYRVRRSRRSNQSPLTPSR